jgi:predicted RNA-binding protein YlqC (UPF0109 family)
MATIPDEVTVNEAPGGAVLQLRVAPTDLGRIIGRGGEHIHALRWLVSAVGARAGHKIVLELIEP